MRRRCSSPLDAFYQNYGGRGISVCAEWTLFENFLADMGEKPDGMTLERIDNDGHYEPDNCRWATPKDQARNRRSNRLLEHDGQTSVIAELAEEHGVASGTIRKRLSMGWSVERALHQPVCANASNGDVKGA